MSDEPIFFLLEKTVLLLNRDFWGTGMLRENGD